MKVVLVSVSIALLLWQLWRSRLSWYWRWLWLPVVASLVLMTMPPSLVRPISPLVVLTPGNATSEQEAQQWAHQHDAALLRMPTEPTRAELAVLQRDPQQTLQLFGYGLSAATWQQMPARVVSWTAPTVPDWQLSSDRQVMLGNPLNIRLQTPDNAHAVQLRDARNEVIADAPVLSGVAALKWQPTAVGHYDWLLQVHDQNGLLLRELPLAFAVAPPQITRVQGYFSAPSFEQRALRDWLQQTGMQGEFLTQTGQQLQRRDGFNLEQTGGPANKTATDHDNQPDDALLLLDLRSWHQSGGALRSQLLQRVARGATLALLADGSEAELAVRSAASKQLAAAWRQLTESEQAFVIGETSLQRAGWQLQVNRDWQRLVLASDGADVAHDTILRRPWQQGWIIWVGVNDSHRLWQRARNQYAQWWQQTLALPTRGGPLLHSPEPGIARAPTALCLDNIVMPAPQQNADAITLSLQTPSGVTETLPMQTSSWPGQQCALYTPATAGWYRILAPVMARWRVYEQAPLPEQQQRAAYEATRLHSQRGPAPPATSALPIPRWPFALLFLICLAAIWWRERQLPPR